MTGLRILSLGIGLAAGLSFMRPHTGAVVPQAMRGAIAAALSPEVQHTNWKAFYSKLPDTLTLRFENDTATVLSSMGSPVLQSTYKLKNDIITFHDFGGINPCDQSGSYHVKINGDTLTLVVDEDPCDSRTGMLIIKPWIRKN